MRPKKKNLQLRVLLRAVERLFCNGPCRIVGMIIFFSSVIWFPLLVCYLVYWDQDRYEKARRHEITDKLHAAFALNQGQYLGGQGCSFSRHNDGEQQQLSLQDVCRQAAVKYCEDPKDQTFGGFSDVDVHMKQCNPVTDPASISQCTKRKTLFGGDDRFYLGIGHDYCTPNNDASSDTPQRLVYEYCAYNAQQFCENLAQFNPKP